MPLSKEEAIDYRHTLASFRWQTRKFLPYVKTEAAESWRWPLLKAMPLQHYTPSEGLISDPEDDNCSYSSNGSKSVSGNNGDNGDNDNEAEETDKQLFMKDINEEYLENNDGNVSPQTQELDRLLRSDDVNEASGMLPAKTTDLDQLMSPFLVPLYEELVHLSAKYDTVELKYDTKLSSVIIERAMAGVDTAEKLLKFLDASVIAVKNTTSRGVLFNWQSVLSCARQCKEFSPELVNKVEQHMKTMYPEADAVLSEKRKIGFIKMLLLTARLCGVTIAATPEILKVDIEPYLRVNSEDTPIKESNGDVEAFTETSKATGLTNGSEDVNMKSDGDADDETNSDDSGIVNNLSISEKSAAVLKRFRKIMAKNPTRPIKTPEVRLDHVRLFFNKYRNLSEPFEPLLQYFFTVENLQKALRHFPLDLKLWVLDDQLRENKQSLLITDFVNVADYLPLPLRQRAPTSSSHPPLLQHLRHHDWGFLVDTRYQKRRCIWCFALGARFLKRGPSGRKELCLSCEERYLKVVYKEWKTERRIHKKVRGQIKKMVKSTRRGERFRYSIVRNLANGSETWESIQKPLVDNLTWHPRCAWCRTRAEEVNRTGPEGPHTLCSNCAAAYELRNQNLEIKQPPSTMNQQSSDQTAQEDLERGQGCSSSSGSSSGESDTGNKGGEAIVGMDDTMNEG